MTSRRRPVPARAAMRTGLVVGLGLVLGAGLSACSATNTITTDRSYQASDGVGVDLGDVTATNLIVLAAEEGAPGTMLGAVSNAGSSDAELTFMTPDSGGPVSIDVPAGETVVLGPDDEAVDLEEVPVAPGAYLEVSVSTDQGGTSSVRVPVLDGALPEYADLVPDAG